MSHWQRRLWTKRTTPGDGHHDEDNPGLFTHTLHTFTRGLFISSVLLLTPDARAAETSKLSTTHLWAEVENTDMAREAKRSVEALKCISKIELQRNTVKIYREIIKKKNSKTAVGLKVEMETEVDKDDKVLTGFKVNLMLCFPWSDQQKWIKKRSTANRGKVLLSGTSLLIISFTSTLENKKHYRALSQTEDKLSSWSCEQVHSSKNILTPTSTWSEPLSSCLWRISK